MCPTTNANGHAMRGTTMRPTTNASLSTILRTSLLYATTPTTNDVPTIVCASMLHASTTPTTNANVPTFMRTSLL